MDAIKGFINADINVQLRPLIAFHFEINFPEMLLIVFNAALSS